MKYFFVAFVLLVICVLVVGLSAPDYALAYVDHRLIDASRISGNPPLLLEARSSLHTFRYSRTPAPKATKFRITRKDEPARIVPAPTAVINASAYQFGRMPSRLLPGGVLGPGVDLATVAPPANVIPVTYFEDFENKFEGHVNQDFAIGWTGYTVWGDPTSDGEFSTRHSGTWAQKISGEATFRGGIFRQFPTAPGTLYTMRTFAHLYELGGGAVHIGVDPYGGTNPSAPSVIWQPQGTLLGQWMELTASGQAQSQGMTVFLEGYSVYDDNTNAYFDDFSLAAFVPA